MTVFEYVKSLRPALPMSREKTPKGQPCQLASNGEVKRWIKDGSMVMNGERWAPEEDMPPMVWQLVFFPKSASKTTLI